MRLELNHRTHYQYSAAVFFEPLVVRLRPRCDPTQVLHRYDMHVQPQPVGVSPCIDLAGNISDTVWFAGEHAQLLVTTSAVVETARADPFHFLVTDATALTLPVVYSPRLQPALRHYLEREAEEDSVRLFSQAIQKEARYETLPFLTLLALRIPDSFQYLIREHGDAWTPRETLANGRGACRDFAMLYIDACRCAGIAARFVSGYAYSDAAATHHLHAWAEVFLPGAGWRGFDPSEGLSIGERHIAVAAGRTAQDTSPTFGSYRGDAQLLSLTTAVIVATNVD